MGDPRLSCNLMCHLNQTNSKRTIATNMSKLNLNLSASLNIFKLIAKPSLCLPHATVPTFNDLPIPLNKAFSGNGEKKVDIKAVVLDKDDCFAYPDHNEVYEAYKVCCLSSQFHSGTL